MSVKADVDRGLQIRAELQRLEDELAEIETRLKKAGLAGEHVDLVDDELEGKQWIAQGTTAAVPVIFTSDLLMKTFGHETIMHGRIAAVAGERLTEFYKPVTTWKTLCDSPKLFRRNAAAILGDKAPEFVSACVVRDKFGVPRSQIKIDWGRAA